MVAFVFLSGCGSQSALPTTSMRIGSKTYTLEIAADDASREHGLMERDDLAEDHGMIFVYPKPQAMNFWMRHTRFALDIVFLDSNGLVVSSSSMKPYDETPTPSAAPAKYAIELNAGEVAANGAKVGDLLKVPPIVVAK